MKIVLVILLLALVVVCYANDEKKAFSSIVRRSKRGIFDCKALHQPCTGIIKCCGSLQCYWVDGYSMIKDGKCVTCIGRQERCQKDTQCCSGLVCQKGKMAYIDGLCDHKRPRGGDCHEGDQCLSGNCSITAGNILSGEEGKCE